MVGSVRQRSGGVRIPVLLVVLLLGSFAALLAMASVASGAKPSPSKLPSKVSIPVVISLSGAAGLPGGEIADGMKFAAAEINKTKFLGSTKLDLQFQDDQTNTDRAIRLVSDAVQSKAPAMLGPAVSSLALATAPIAQDGKLPYVASQAQSSGLKPMLQRGSFIFRLTSPQLNYQQITVDYLVKKAVKSTALLYVQDGAANTEWAQKIMPPLLSKAGISVTDTIGFPSSQTDFSALATRLQQAAPDAVGVSTLSGQSSTLVSQLRLAGYKGLLYADNSFGGNSLQGAGALANGSVWAADYAPWLTAPSAVKFTKAWRTQYKEDPLNFNAEGYDAVYFLARALLLGQTTDREKLRNAMQAVTRKGMEGAVGQINFLRTQDAYVTGTLLQWVNGGVVPAR
jgi:branched-chain amino acid transport system substrate-binding protein